MEPRELVDFIRNCRQSEIYCELYKTMSDNHDCSGISCSDCRKITYGIIADTIEQALNQSKSTGLPEGVEWPRFEDGELVKFGNHICQQLENPKGETLELEGGVRSFTFAIDFVSVSDGKNELCFLYGEPIKRPEPEVLDADGVPIKVGDTVWYVDHEGNCIERIVDRFETRSDLERVMVFFTNGLFMHPEELTHRKPDTLEAIEADAAKDPCAYFNGRTPDKCADCKLHADDDGFDFDVQFAECRTAMARDLLARQRKLMGGE